jgi:membrane protease YdiL (CAAX protease family)
MHLRRVFLGRSGLRAGWRFALYIALLFAFSKAFYWALATATGYQSAPGWQAGDSVLDGFVASAVAVLAALIMGKLEHRSLADYGLTRRGAFGLPFWEGVLWGLATSVAMIVSLAALGAVSVHGLALHGAPLLRSGLIWWVVFLFVGFSEELQFRGYLQRALTDGMGFWPGAVLISTVFGAIHFYFKPQESWLDAVNVALFGLFWCFTLRRTGALWFAMGHHAMSDYADMVIFGQPNTGNDGQPLSGHLLDATYHGPAWLTGGVCGTEASVLEIPILLALFALFHLRHRGTTRRGLPVAAPAEAAAT